ncbi:hypothetical protein [Sporofaciens sp. SGI.106]|uniref:hypothetical protein n=1 Tax=Sporofaciens sp. SGI.106 TaxID=3420568 RepID=UPI002A9916F1|nr:hypothetical protein [Lachnoclostridium sp.]
MQIRKKPISKLGLGVLSSLSESYMLLPFTIFSSLLSGKIATVNFFVPVVILYSIERACLIALRGFGKISNPYRIMKSGMVMALSGALLMVLSYLYRPLLIVSSLLIGVGLSPVRAMFIPVFSILAERDASLKKGKSIGMILYLLIMILALGLGKSNLPIVPLLFLLYISSALWIVLRLDGDALFDGRKAFDTSKKSPAFFIFGILALLSLLILRQYQQSGVSVLMWLTPIAVIFFIDVEMYRRRHYMDYSFQTYWVGAMKSFVLLYSLVYHTSVSNTTMAMLVYLAIAVSGIVSDMVRKMMAKHLSGSRLNNVCILLSAVLSFLLTLPSQVVNLTGIVLCGIFANIVVSEVSARYMKDERYVREERALVRIRLQTTGSIIEQLILFFTIYMLGEMRIHQNLLEPYAAGIPNPGVSLLLRTTGLICCTLLLLGAVLIVCFAGKRRKNGT